MIRRPPRSTQGVSSAASDVYKRQSYRSLFFSSTSLKSFDPTPYRSKSATVTTAGFVCCMLARRLCCVCARACRVNLPARGTVIVLVHTHTHRIVIIWLVASICDKSCSRDICACPDCGGGLRALSLDPASADSDGVAPAGAAFHGVAIPRRSTVC